MYENSHEETNTQNGRIILFTVYFSHSRYIGGQANPIGSKQSRLCRLLIVVCLNNDLCLLCVRVSIKMHMTVQSGPVILLTFYATRISMFFPKGVSLILTTKTSDKTRQRVHTLSTVSCFFSPEGLVLLSLLPFYYLDLLAWSACTEPTFFSCLRFFLFPPVSPVSRIASIKFPLVFFFSLPPPSILSLTSRLWTLVLCMMRRSRWSIGSCGCGYRLLVGIASSLHLYYDFVGFQVLSPLHTHTYYRPRFCSRSRSRCRPHPCLLTYPCAHSRTLPPSRPCLRPCSHRRFLPFITGALFPPLYHIVRQAPSLASEAAGYTQAPPPVYIVCVCVCVYLLNCT